MKIYKGEDGKDYLVEVCNDADTHAVEIGRFDTFAASAGEYDRLTKGNPPLRVVMRHRAHVYRCHIPDRLKSPTDRRE